MFSRVDYDGKIIKPVTNWHRNKRVCFGITERHGLTIAEDSLSLDTSKLRRAEKCRIEIRQIGHEVLKDKSITDWPTFQKRMKERGVNVKCLWKDDARTKIKTLVYAKGNHSFIASKIGKNYTPTGLLTQFEANLKSQMAPPVKAAPTPATAPQPQAPAIIPCQRHHSEANRQTTPTWYLAEACPTTSLTSSKCTTNSEAAERLQSLGGFFR